MKKTKLKMNSSHAFSRGIILFLAILTLLLLIFDYPRTQNHCPPAANGRADLSGYYFNSQGITPLSGKWECYDGLLSSQDFATRDFTPSYTSLASAKAKPEGATYRLIAERRPENEGLGMRIPAAYGSYHLFVNGIDIGAGSAFRAGYEYFTTGNAPQLEIILQVAPSAHFYGGTNGTPEIGLAEQIKSRMVRYLVGDLTLFLFLLITAVLAFFLNFMDAQSKYYRYLALSLLFGCIAVSGLREGLIFGSTPFLPTVFTRKLTEVSAPLSVLFLCQFFFDRFPVKKSIFSRHTVLSLNVIASLAVAVLPFWSWCAFAALIVTRLVMIFGSFACLTRALGAVGEKTPFAAAYTFGISLFFLASIADTVTFFFGHHRPFAWFMLALFACVPFAAFLKEFKDIRADYGMTHFSLEQQVSAAKMELEETKSLYEKQGATDTLTGVSSRAYGEYLLTTRTAKDFGDVDPFTALLLDVDDFTRINLQYGFEEGNRVLVNTAGALEKLCGEKATVCRWGSDEFLLLFPDCGAHEVPGILKEMKKHLDRANVSDREWISYCWSAATYGDSDTLASLMRRLTEHMAEAKRKGRNSMVTDDANPAAAQINLSSE